MHLNRNKRSRELPLLLCGMVSEITHRCIEVAQEPDHGAHDRAQRPILGSFEGAEGTSELSQQNYGGEPLEEQEHPGLVLRALQLHSPSVELTNHNHGGDSACCQ